MKIRHSFLFVPAALSVILFFFLGAASPRAEEILKYSCSSQVYDAIEVLRLDTFTRETGIRVQVSAVSSQEAISRLKRGDSDLASTAERIDRALQDAGFAEIPFCKDPLAIIVNKSCPIRNLTETQLRSIFTGRIANWKELGGPYAEIVRVVPGEGTAAYRNFSRLVMGGQPVHHDVMTTKSTMVIEVTKNLPWSISFIARGAARWLRQDLRLVKVNGLAPDDERYPYYQVFSFVTRDKPVGAAKAFIDFAMSERGKKIIVLRGMIP